MERTHADAVVIGEEAVSLGQTNTDLIRSAALSVILDPIDGTWNYAHGLGVFGIMLAVVKRSETVFGLIYEPISDNWIWAAKGSGAWAGRPNGPSQRLSVSGSKAEIQDSSGFVYMPLFPSDVQPRLAAAATEMRRVTSLGCSAHEYRLQAEGAADFCLNANLNPWDHAAGVLILQEAGGVARLLDGTPYAPGLKDGRLLTACSEILWTDLANRFNRALAD